MVLHSLTSFSEHPDMIGVVSGKGSIDPIYHPFAKIKKRDKIAYYAIRDCVIVGIFNVASEMEYLEDEIWGPSCVFKITPETLPPPHEVLDFKRLVQNPDVQFDLFPQKKNWQQYVRGHACRPLTDRDFTIIRRRLMDGKDLIRFPEVRPP